MMWACSQSWIDENHEQADAAGGGLGFDTRLTNPLYAGSRYQIRFAPGTLV
jgi:hypothetical protein